MASVELPAQQVLSELAARGVNDVVLSVVASPQSTVVGGAKESVRELVAEWEARGVMAREVAVDVASHSPQVDPILDDLAEALEDIEPCEPTVPYYSATLYDPRDPADFDAYYWVGQPAPRGALRRRRAGRPRRRLPGVRRAVPAPAAHPRGRPERPQPRHQRSPRWPACAASRSCRTACAACVADLHSAGAAIDFSVLWPDGDLVDAPLPTWTHRAPDARPATSRSTARATLAVHPLLGAHVRLPEEPERHVWQSDVGTDAQPWLGDHQVHGVAALPGAAYCEMALAAARTVLGEAAEVRDITLRGDAAARRADRRSPRSRR